MNAGVVVLYLNMQQKRFIQVNSACQRLGQLFIHICVCLELISLNTNWQFAWASNIVTLISSFIVDRNERASEWASKTKRNKIKQKKIQSADKSCTVGQNAFAFEKTIGKWLGFLVPQITLMLVRNWKFKWVNNLYLPFGCVFGHQVQPISCFTLKLTHRFRFFSISNVHENESS